MEQHQELPQENDNPLLPAEIRNRSPQAFDKKCILLEHTKKSLHFIENILNCKKLLMFYGKFYKVINRYSNVFLGYKYPATINLFAGNVNEEIRRGALYIQELIKIIKICMPLFLRLQKDKHAHVSLDKICSKVKTKLQISLFTLIIGIKL